MKTTNLRVGRRGGCQLTHFSTSADQSCARSAIVSGQPFAGLRQRPDLAQDQVVEPRSVHKVPTHPLLPKCRSLLAGWLALAVACLLPPHHATAQTTALRISGLRHFYSAPYLLDFNFSIRDQSNRVVVVDPSQFTVVCKESGTAISASETGSRLLTDNKQLKCFVVLDYTLSMLDPFINGDGNGDFKSDSAEAMELGAKTLLNALPDDAEVGLFEFHRADAGFPPKKVASLMRDKAYLTNQIDQIWNEVVWTSGSTKCWDALYLALSEFPTANPADDQRFLVFLSDGKDESSTYSTGNVISLAQTKGVRIYAVGYGQELTPAPLQNLAAQTGGQYYPAGSVAELTQRFQEVALDLRSQYILRWATLKRTSSSFTPSFEITYSGVKTSATATAYVPTSYAGDELQGRLRFDTSLNPGNVASLVLRASYIPRGITRLRVNFATAWPFKLERVWFGEGGVCPTNWTFTVQQTNGIGYFEFSSPTPANPFTALPFATLGKLVEFEFRGVADLSKCFYELSVDNSLYAQPGGPSFVVEDASAVSSALTELPQGTPIWWLNRYGFTSGLILAEITDHDGDGVPTGQEYLAGTNPTNAASVFRMLGATQGQGGWHITFNTEKDRFYRVDYSDTFSAWQVLQTNLLGTGQPRTVVDTAARTHRYYRAVMTGITNPIPPGMAFIPAGSFIMGDTFNEGDSSERPTHSVYVSDFCMDQYEVTKALWDEVRVWANANGYDLGTVGSGKASNHPVHSINWYDAVKWCNARSEKEGLTPAYYTSAAKTTVYRAGQLDLQNDWVKWDTGYRLPTEAEWEKAARGGVAGRRFPWSDSDTIQHSRANYNSSSSYNYDTSPTRGYHPNFAVGATPYTSPVGSFASNSYGLHDMAGNVYEWCWDCFSASWYSSANATQNDTRGPDQPLNSRVLRGGCWGNSAFEVRCALRTYGTPSVAYAGNVGFRCVLPRSGSGAPLLTLSLNRFDAASEASQYARWWGSAPQSYEFDASVDAGGNPTSGSLKVTVNFNLATYGEENQFAALRSFAAPIDATKVAQLEMDVLWHPNSPKRPSDDFGPFEVGFRYSDWSWHTLAEVAIPTTPGWVRIVAPVNPTLPKLDQVQGIFFKMWSGYPSWGQTGTAVFWVDNIRLKTLGGVTVP